MLIHVDHVVRAWIVAHRLGALDGVMWTLSAIGRGGAVFAVIALALTIARRRARDFVQMGLALVLASVLSNQVLKPAFHRERPFVSSPAVAVIGGRPHDASFPSGHAANAFAAAVTLSNLLPGWTAAWWAIACAIGYSRLYLGVHYPGDVVGGALLGVAVGAVVVKLVGDRTAREASRL